jgi:penicillin-binding protein 1C
MRVRSDLANGGRIATTLDHDVQHATEQAARRWLNNFGGAIGNAAVIVVDVPTTSVLARVGSADFFNTPGGGQVDVCRASRSPGSALKPFVYALGMERQCLYASEMLFDGPLDYGLYDPENYDGKNRGAVTASSALKRSLNVPAITVLERVGTASFCGFLKRLGITTLDRTAEHYGLGLVIGSCEVRLDELAAAYCMLANLGEYRPLRTLTDVPPAKPARMLSRGTCLKIYEMLEQALPAEVHCGAMPAVGADPRVCWKTGTSTKHRDAWSFVFNRQYLVGVWMGNNDSTPSRCLVGAEAALPLAGQLFRSLSVRNTPIWPEGGGDLREVTVCARSGLPRSEWCGQTGQVLLPRSQYKHRICDVHYPVLTARGKDGSAPVQVLERWPGTARGWDLARISAPFQRRKLAGREPTHRRKALQIIAPADKAAYVLTSEANGDRLTLHASLDQDVSLHWYLDDRYAGKSQPEQRLTMPLESGRHTLACMAEDGAVDLVSFDVLSPSRSPFLLD